MAQLSQQELSRIGAYYAAQQAAGGPLISEPTVYDVSSLIVVTSFFDDEDAASSIMLLTSVMVGVSLRYVSVIDVQLDFIVSLPIFGWAAFFVKPRLALGLSRNTSEVT